MKVALIATTIYLSIVGVVVIFPLNVFATNCGVYGAIYSIAEPDMLSAIQTKLSLMQKNGDLERQKKAFIENSIAHILRPAPVDGVSDLNNRQAKSWLFDPSIVLDHTIKSSTGQVIATKGTKINPLKFKQFDEALIFINGDNKNKLDWMAREIQKDKKTYSQLKIILVNGDINQTAKSLKTRVYFDQDGILCKRFDIKHTPTMVYQANVNGVKIPRLMIKEFSDAS